MATQQDTLNEIAKKLGRLEKTTCCGLDKVEQAVINNGSGGGGTPTPETIVRTGFAVVGGGESLDFSEFGVNIRSVSLTIIEAPTNSDTVTINTDDGGSVLSYAGFSTSWSIDKETDLTLGGIRIDVAGAAKVAVTYTFV